jgi:hypothetical protein
MPCVLLHASPVREESGLFQNYVFFETTDQQASLSAHVRPDKAESFPHGTEGLRDSASVVSPIGFTKGTWRRPSFDHVLGDARLRDLKPELERFAVDAWRAPKRIFDGHPPDQYAQLRVDLRSPSLWARLPTPVAAKAGSVPTHERLGPDDCENLQDRRKPEIQLDKEPAIMVREPDATKQPTLTTFN